MPIAIHLVLGRCARAAAPVILVAFALSCLGCGGGSGADGGAAVLNLALKTSPNNLDPALVVDVGEGEICAQLYQGLVGFSPEGDIVPALARRWRIEDGGRRYVFELDTRMRFSDGRRVVSADVQRSFERVLGPQSRSSRRWVLDRLVGAEAFGAGRADGVAGVSTPDDSTVVLELRDPFKPFLSMLALPAAMVAASPASEKDATLPVGAGPWVLAAWERGDYLSLVPNPYHPRASRTLDEIRYRIIPESFTRVAGFESGTLDILEVPQAELRRFHDGEYRSLIQSRPELRVHYIGLNNGAPKLSDVRVRRALNMAVDVERLIEVLAGGEGTRAAGSIPPGLAGHVEREPYPFDPSGARRLLAEAGYPDGLAVEIWLRESPEGGRMVEAVQGYLAEVGVEVTLVRREWSAFKEAVSAGRVDAFFLDWFGDYPDAENFLYPLFHSDNVGGGGNRAFFRDDEVDRLINEASRTFDDAECSRMYARIDSLVYAQAPWIYLYFPRSAVVVSDRISGYRLPTLYLGHDFTSVRKTN